MCTTLRRVAAAAALLVWLLLAGSAQAAGPYEPNDVPESAFGPIGTAGGLHVVEAAGETALDEDWYSFFVPEGQHDVAIGLEQLTPAGSLCLRLHAELEGVVSELASVGADAADPQPSLLSDTVTGPARAFVSVDGCAGYAAPPAPYRLTLQGDWPDSDPRPAEELADLDGFVGESGSPVGGAVSTRCHVAATQLRAASSRYRAARRAHRRQHSGASRRRLAAARTATTRAIKKVVRVC